MRAYRRLYVVAFVFVGLVLTGVGCSNPLKPSCDLPKDGNYDPCKGLGAGNVPDPPAGGIAASLAKITSFAVYKGNCQGDGSNCLDPMPDDPLAQKVDVSELKTFWIATYKQEVTVKACMWYAGYKKRQILMSISIPPFGGVEVKGVEEDLFALDKKNDVCRAMAFTLAFPDGSGDSVNTATARIFLYESGWDLGEKSYENRVNLGFRKTGS